MAFTPLQSSVGALFIHLASTSHYALLGSSIGFSSVLANAVLKLSPMDIAISLGLFASAALTKALFPQFAPLLPESALLQPGSLLVSQFDGSVGIARTLLYAVSGSLVGLGTKYGCGCTSGHMIAGLSRLRVRSIVAVAAFSASAMGVVKFLGLGPEAISGVPNYIRDSANDVVPIGVWALLAACGILVYGVLPRIGKGGGVWTKLSVSLFNGFLFGLGLHISGMLQVSKTQGFLAMLTPQQFDPSLAMILVFCVLPNVFVWRKVENPVLVEKWSLATSNEVTTGLILGSLTFGVGWGLLGVCPGPGILDSWWFGLQFAGPWVGGFLGARILSMLK